MKRSLFLIAFLAAVPLWAGEKEYPDFVEEVYLSTGAALSLAFPGEASAPETLRLSAAQKDRVERRLGWRLVEESFLIHRAPSGYAVVTEEVGKYKPITFLVKAGVDFKVQRVEVLVYREPRGAEVRTPRFLGQLKGKSARSPLRINRDVVNITGATLSVRAMSAGVKKILCVLEEAYGVQSPPVDQKRP